MAETIPNPNPNPNSNSGVEPKSPEHPRLQSNVRRLWLIGGALITGAALLIPQAIHTPKAPRYSANNPAASTCVPPAQLGDIAGDFHNQETWLTFHNSVRELRGSQPLEISEALNEKARATAKYMIEHDLWAHPSASNSVGTSSVMMLSGVERAGENLGQASVRTSAGDDCALRTIAQALTESPSHYVNMIDPGFTDMGIAIDTYGSHGEQANRQLVVIEFADIQQ